MPANENEVQSQVNRRDWLKSAAIFTVGSLLSQRIIGASFRKNPTILVVSGWQDVNIGDIGHTIGLLHVLETFLPEAKVILWKKSNGEDVRRMLNENFPKVKIIYGGVNAEKYPENPEILMAFESADLMIHGSGPMLVGADNLAAWMKHTTKPFGVFGVTLENPNESQKNILKKASFIFTRETLSIEYLKKAGIEGPHIQFAPDATFYINIRNDQKANQFLKENGLEDKKIICAIPRLRYTPYHQFNPNRNGWSDEKIRQVEETNLKYKEIDHAKLRESMIAWVRETKQKVLVCPEMTY